MTWLVIGVATAHNPHPLRLHQYAPSMAIPCAITTTHLSLMACLTMSKAVSYCSPHVNTVSLLNMSFEALCQCSIAFHEVTMQTSHTQHTVHLCLVLVVHASVE